MPRTRWVIALLACLILGQFPIVSNAETYIPTPVIEQPTFLPTPTFNIVKDEDVDYLALTIWGEARGMSDYHMRSVGSVIINRTHSGKYPATIKAVVLQPYQFSVWSKSNPNYTKIQAVRAALTNPVKLPQDYGVYLHARQIAVELLTNGPTTKAMSFHSKKGNHVYF